MDDYEEDFEHTLPLVLHQRSASPVDGMPVIMGRRDRGCDFRRANQPVADMSSLFQGKQNFDEDLSGWDVSAVTTMAFMFNQAASFNGDLSNWDVSRVTNMLFMFDDAVRLGSEALEHYARHGHL